MRLRFEGWLNQREDMNDDARKLFNEGIICYGVKAYRAAFLMTYVGFLSVLRTRLLNCDLPLNFNKKIENEEERNKQWKILCDKLRNEDKWEEELKAQLEKEDNVFLINESLRIQLKNWRVIRNICAHAKDREITYADVESFWVFIQSYYNRIVVYGGKEALMIKFNNHYNSEITPPNTDVKYIVSQITESVPTIEITEFLLFAYESSKLIGRNIKSSKRVQFWKYVITTEDKILKQEFFRFIKQNAEEALGFILLDPSLITYFYDDEEFLWRLIKKENLSKLLYSNYNNENIWILITRLLQLDILKYEENKDKKREIFQVVSEVFNDKEINISQNYIKILIDSGFMEFLEEYTLDSRYLDYPDGINYMNNKYCLIKFYLENKEDINKYVMKNIKKIYEKVHYGNFCYMMARLIDNNEKIKKMIYEEDE